MSTELCLRFTLHGKQVWIYEQDYIDSDGALMPEPFHDQVTMGLGISYAHLYPNGEIKRFDRVIGSKSDLKREL